MKSSFFEFNIARTALHTARMGIAVANHNISNASTDGYSRQVAQIKAGMPMNTRNGRGLIGTGSEVYGVTQIRDLYLDKKYQAESGVLGEYDVKQNQLNFIENIFNSMSDTGLNALIDNMFASMQELTQNSGDGTFRANMLRAADTVADHINTLATNLQKQQADINMEVNATVQIINGLGQQIRNINDQIQKLEMDGSQANDLRDSRANLLDELSRYVNIDTNELVRNQNTGVKEFVVMINGYPFVDNKDLYTLQVVSRDEKQNPMDVGDLYDISFTNGQPFDIYHPNLKGELKGLIDARDGNNGYHFTTTATSSVTLTAANQLTITDPTRVDLQQTGIMSIKDPVSGIVREYRYNSFTVSADGMTIVFNFDDNLPPYADGNTDISSCKTTTYKGVPHYMNKLNSLVRTLAMAFNEGLAYDGTQITGVSGHINNYDQYGNTGNLFFNYEGNTSTGISNYSNITCANFCVDEKVLKDPKLFAAAKYSSSDESDNEALMELLTISNERHVFAEGRVTDYINGISSELGIDLKQAMNFSLNYTDVTTSIDIQRKSISGVDLNEESINMVRFNQLYQAAATLINTIDNIYDITINRLGNF